MLACLARYKFSAFVIVVAMLLIVATNEVNGIRNVVKENLNAVARLSNATRLDREFLQFVSLARALYDATPGVTSKDVKTAFDLLWSRVNEQIDTKKTVGVKTIENGMGTLKQLAESLVDIDPVVHDLEANDDRGMRAINQFDAKYSAQLYQLVQLAYEEMANRSVNAATAQRATAQTIERLQWLFLLVSIIGFLMLRSDLLGIRRLNEELTRQEAEIQNFAYTDSLTNLSNRRHFDEQMARLNADETGADAHLLLIDLDGFKLVNDQHGHSVGDQLLAEVAMRLRRALGEASVVARIGGDEFGVILKAGDARARAAATTILAILQEPVELEHHTVFINASIGIAGTRGRRSCGPAMLREADTALYAAKAEGRGQFQVFTGALLSKKSASVVSLEAHSKRKKHTPA